MAANKGPTSGTGKYQRSGIDVGGREKGEISMDQDFVKDRGIRGVSPSFGQAY